MIISFNDCRYLVPLESVEETTVVKITDQNIKVAKWFPTKPPQPVYWEITELPHTVEAMPAGHTEVKAFTVPKSGDAWIKLLKEKTPVEVFLNFNLEDFMAHTHSALCQRIVTDVVLTYEQWPMFAVGNYEIVGFERPDWIHICAELQLRTSFNAASRRRAHRSRIR